MRAFLAWLNKPEIKSFIAVLAFLGMTPPAVIWAFQRAPLFFFSYAFQAQAKADSIRTVRLIDARATDLETTLVSYMGKRFDRQERILVAIPGARRAFVADSLRAAQEAEVMARRLHMFPRESVRLYPAK